MHEVIVIGAGIAGLAAAALVHRAGVSDVVVCEATDRIGGRVRQVDGHMPWPVEEGPEFVHGGRTCLDGEKCQGKPKLCASPVTTGTAGHAAEDGLPDTREGVA